MRLSTKTPAPLLSLALLLGLLLLPPCPVAVCDADAPVVAPHRFKTSIQAPLKLLPANPRYFGDGSGQAVYLTGSHTWLNFQERVDGGRPPVNFADYLNLLERFNHNFVRLWVWEDARHSPLPFQRTGDGLARDGQAKFDLNELNPEFFRRLRSRVEQAGERGIYVSVMLFQGWSVESRNNDRDPWPLHPFHRDNNVNGIDGDPNDNGEGEETHSLELAAVNEIQRRYVKAMIDALSDLDNVLWEISNESPAGSTAWQYSLIRYIRDQEAEKPNRHPIGMTLQYQGDTPALFDSPAEWISPGSENEATAERYRSNPPSSTGAKVIISDTDHLFTEQAPPDAAWVWKSFLRGYQPIFMDPVHESRWQLIREAMSAARSYAQRMDLKNMEPCGDLASTGYCMASTSISRPEFLVYLPEKETHPLTAWIDWLPHGIESWLRTSSTPTLEVAVDLSTIADSLRVEWFNPATGRTVAASNARGRARRLFKAPFRGSAVLYLSRA
jgi:hypothetical protein